ncbi:MAG: glycosyltransferase family 4 protein [Candidatus Margulisiibacteriota bacterium]
MPLKKIKVGIIQPFINTVGGVEEVIACQVENLPEFEWTLYGLSFDEALIARHYPSLAALKKNQALNLTAIRLPSRFQRREILDLLEVISFSFLGLGKKFDREDILIAHYPFATLLSLFTKKPVIWYCHCLKRYLYEAEIQREYEKIWGEPSLFYRLLKSALAGLEKMAARRMRAVLCNSEHTRRKLEKYLNINGRVIPPAIDPQNVDQVEYGNFILSPSRLVNYKRVDLAIAAMQYLPQIKLKVVGAGPEEIKLKKLVKDLALKNVEFMEPQASLAELYKKCLAVIYLSKDEDYGIVPREAMGWKKPVIAAKDGGGILEAVIDNENGFLVELNAEEIADRIKFLAENRELAGKLGGSGYESVRKLTWPDHAEKLKGVINELAGLF